MKQLNQDFSNNFSQSLQDTIPACIKILDIKGNLLSMNAPGLGIMEIDDFKLFEGKSWIEFWEGEDKKKVVKAIAQAKKGQVGHFIGYTKTAKGNYKWWDVLVSPIFDNRNKVYKLLSISRDITQEKLTEIKIEEAQKNLYFLSEASKLLSSSLDYETTLKSVARIAVSHIGDWCGVEMLNERGEIEQVAVTHKDPKKIKWAKQYRKENPPNMNNNFGLPLVIKTGKSLLYPLITDELLVKSAKNKKELDLARSLNIKSAIMVPILVKKKAIGAISFISTTNRQYGDSDLSMAEELASRASLAIENAKLYQQAEENERKFKAFVDSNIVGVFTSDKEGKILSSNDGFLKIIGYSRKDLDQGKLNRWKLTPKEYEDIDKKAMKELKTTGSTIPWEKEYIKQDGSQVPVIVGATMVDLKTGENITIVLDITERKRLEQRKDEFIGIASHELKTPLTSIKGYVQILERIIEEMGSSRAKILVSKTNTYINRMNSLITDLLDVSKIQAGKMQFNMEKFDFNELVQEGIEAISPISPKHEIICDDCISQIIYGDKNRLEQVFMNILSNAVKYSPDASKIIVTVKKEDSQIKVGVRDFGIGVPKSSQTKLFQRFYRAQKTANQFSGLGIGLYISSEIIKRHEGKIWFESAERKGSTFYFALPLKSN